MDDLPRLFERLIPAPIDDVFRVFADQVAPRRQVKALIGFKRKEHVMTSTDHILNEPQAVTTDHGLRVLDRLVGSWRITGDAEGEIRWEWAEGRFFLLQHIDLVHGGRTIKGMEVIGRIHPLDGEPGADIRTRVYSFLDGFTIDYVYELDGDTLTIWGGEKGSPAFYRATFSADGNTLTGAWQWPGGGYGIVARRIRESGGPSKGG